MSVNINLSYKTRKEEYKPTDELTVQIYYYYSKRKLNISTGIKVQIKDWDENWKKKRDKNPVKKSDLKYSIKNFLIKQKIKEIEDIVDRIKVNNQIPSIELIKTHLKKKQKVKEIKNLVEVDFLYIIDLYLKSSESDVTTREGYKKSIRNSLKKIHDFTSFYENELNNRLLIGDIDDEFQRRLLKFLSDKGEQPSTIRKRLKLLVSIINWSKKNNYSQKQIRIIKFTHDFEKDVIYLLREEVLSLYNFNKFNYTNPNHRKYTFEYIEDFLKNGKKITYTNLEIYRDMIVFGCGLGCRFGDLVNLKLDNYQFSKDRTKGFFVFRMEKSRVRKQVKVPINKLTFQIWKKYSKNKKRKDYIFPRTKMGKPISNQKVNKHIKEIGRIVELKRLVSKPKFNIEGKIIDGSDTRIPLYNLLTTHIIRRTFIREGIENKIPTHILMSMSGHTTEKVFRKYFSTTTKELDDEGEKMFSLDLNNSFKSETPNKENNNSLEVKLQKLKSLFERGLIPQDIYNQKVSELL